MGSRWRSRRPSTSRMSTACVDSNCSSWGSDMMARGMRLEAKEGSRSARMARCSTDACTASTPPLVSPKMSSRLKAGLEASNKLGMGAAGPARPCTPPAAAATAAICCSKEGGRAPKLMPPPPPAGFVGAPPSAPGTADVLGPASALALVPGVGSAAATTAAAAAAAAAWATWSGAGCAGWDVPESGGTGSGTVAGVPPCKSAILAGWQRRANSEESEVQLK
mmetsp:Transcript_23794/g.65409  ORF Transcript_23794/g.65409 Transcript_23794/m.65409 type:complete len:222 (+) Transcript_23794:189-854(+)